MPITKINNISNKILTNKTLLKSLEHISEHGTSFSAGVSLLLAAGVRPISVMLTPDVEKENKQYIITNSISSGLVKFGIVEAIALPIEKAIMKIDKNPKKYLKPKLLEKYIGNNDNVLKSPSYRLVTQLIKLGVGFITAIPKSMITIALIPILMDKLFKNKDKKQVKEQSFKNTPSFGGRIGEQVTKGVASVLNNNSVQNFAKKFEKSEKDIPKHITASTDILLTSAFVYQTNKSKKIEDIRKKVLIFNNIIGTAITLGGGYLLDNLVKKNSSGIINKIKQLNANDIKVAKYIEGINILRPAFIFAGIYYGIVPIVSAYLSEKVVNKYFDKKKIKQ